MRPDHATGSDSPARASRAGTAVHIRHGSRYPHWTKPGGIYAVTSRLADSVPQSKVREWMAERHDIVRTAEMLKRNLTAQELSIVRRLDLRLDRLLNKGYGSCLLALPGVAEIVADTFMHFHKKRYRLYAWCIMPNHIHVVVQPFASYTLSDIHHSWKSFTAKKANAITGRSGTFWQSEYYDHLIRDEQDFQHAVSYTWNNPEAAGIRNWRWRWRSREGPEAFSS